MFTNPLAHSKKEMSPGLGAHKSIQNKYCNEFATIFDVYFKSPAPTALQRGGGSVGRAELPRLKTCSSSTRGAAPATVSIVGKRQILNSFDQFSLKCWLAGEEDFEVFLLAIYILD